MGKRPFGCGHLKPVVVEGRVVVLVNEVVVEGIVVVEVEVVVKEVEEVGGAPVQAATFTR